MPEHADGGALAGGRLELPMPADEGHPLLHSRQSKVAMLGVENVRRREALAIVSNGQPEVGQRVGPLEVDGNLAS